MDWRVTVLFFVAAGSARDPRIFYIQRSEGSYEIRLRSPDGADERVVALEEEPTNLFWAADFTFLYFRAGDEMFRMAWPGGAPRRVLEGIPIAEGRVWMDPGTRRWRAFEVAFGGPDDPYLYEARVYEHGDSWELLARRETHGCESGDGSTCGAEVAEFLGPLPEVLLTDLLEQMRVSYHLERLGMELDDDFEEKLLFFRSGWNWEVGITLHVSFGDTLHGRAPVAWSDRRSGVTKPILEETSGSLDPVAFQEHGEWLLVASEYVSERATLVSWATGEVLWRLPDGARGAVWLPRP